MLHGDLNATLSKAKEIRDASGRNNCLVDLRTMMFKQRDSQILLNTHAFM